MPSPVSAEIMKVAAKAKRALAALTIASSADFSTRSILLMSRILGWPTSASRSRIAPASSSRPRLASISTPAMSASCVPAQAFVTMARSSRRLGAKMPGVSMKTSCEPSTVAMPRSNARVVCTLWDTIATLVPTSALISVDLPTLGAPISAINPQRACSPLRPFADTTSPTACSRKDAWDERRPRLSTIEAVGLDPGARQHGGSGGLLGSALRAAKALGRRQVGKLDGDAEFRIVVGSLALDLTIGGSRQPPRLRPFLQHGLGIAQRPRRRAHALLPQPLDHGGGGRIAAVEIHRANHRLAHVGEDGETPAAARIRLRGAELDRGAEID